MNFNKVIEIDIWSDFGCFTKPFSTTGGLLTYLIPPKTSIIGIIGAILGYKFNDYVEKEDNVKEYSIEKLYDIKISIQPLFDLKTKRVSFNQVSGNINETKIVNIHQDVLIKPYYKLFISFPDYLYDDERLFIDRIKNNQTIYNLYMGRNEFFLSYKLCKIFDYDSYDITIDNVNDFFSDNEVKIFGSLNRKFIKDTELKSVENMNSKNNIIFNFKRGAETKLKSFFEYVVPEYPIRRKNFTEFIFSEVSFYSSKELDECFFSKFSFKDNLTSNEIVELTKIGENKWITMI